MQLRLSDLSEMEKVRINLDLPWKSKIIKLIVRNFGWLGFPYLKDVFWVKFPFFFFEMIDLDFQGLCFWCDCLMRISYHRENRLKLPPCIIVHDLQKTLSSIDWRWTSYNKQDGFRKWRIFALSGSFVLDISYISWFGVQSMK